MSELEKDILQIESMIYIIRGQKVMLDNDLAKLYGVETKAFNQAIKRNLDRFPEDFMFTLNQEELNALNANRTGRGGIRYFPNAFTESGVAMLSSVLGSKHAIQVNISIMRTFVKLRSFLSMEEALSKKVDSLEKNTNKLFKIVFERLDSIEEYIAPKLPANRKKIGLKSDS